MKYKEWLHDWLELYEKESVKPRTYKQYEDVINKRLIPALGDYEMEDLSPIILQRYIVELLQKGNTKTGKGLAPNSVNCIILVLHSSLSMAYVLGLSKEIHVDKIKRPKTSEKPVESFTKEEQKMIEQAVLSDKRDKMFGIILCLYTGLRIGELCGIQMKDISLIDKTITVNKTVQRIYDKKKGTTYIHVGPPKTKTSARTIPIPSLLMNIVKKFYTDNPNHYFLTGKNKPTEPRTYRQFFSRFLKRNGLQQVKFHEIRHTFAVRAIEIPEFDIKSLSEILGHKNVSFTLNVYGSANLQQKVKCMNLLNDLL